MEDNNLVFALDIGTRTVVGVVLEKQLSNMVIKAARLVEHETRAMYDGQIHDVEAVGAVISRVKRELEEELGIPLPQAAVAAAGRALRTAIARVEKPRHHYREFTREEVHALELEAVQQAQMEIIDRDAGDGAPAGEYFCVGYSTISYSLEGQAISNLVGQIGNRAAVEVVATFLPRVVVDSLFSALRRADLQLYSLTLEPIAAMTVAIPPRMRLLNLALVDIGAGTSDIALVKNGSIIGYAMVPVGGDEVTEKIAEQYLLDFNMAEAVKCRIGQSESVSFEDILGNPIQVASSELVDVAREVVRDLALKIAREVLSLNREPPDAVLCVGGGSLTPQLLAELADALELPRNRVGMRTREAITEIKGDFTEIQGPQGVTPLGIAFNALQERPLPFIRVTVNQRQIPLWSLNETTVATALLAAGIGLNDVYGKPGMGLTVEVNGRLKFIKGTPGELPAIKVNGVEASLSTPVEEGAIIEFVKGTDGQDAVCTVKEVIPEVTGEVWVNGERLVIPPRVLVNGQPAELDEQVPDRGRIEYTRQNTLAQILSTAGVEEKFLKETIYHYRLNGQPMVFRWSSCEVRVGGKVVRLDYQVPFGSSIEYRLRSEAPRLKDVLSSHKLSRSIQVKVNGQAIVLPTRRSSIHMNNRMVSLDDFLIDGADISLNLTEQEAILSDIMNHIDINPRASGQLVMKVDGEKAGFTTPIREGSDVEIYWQEN